ncbi:MAG: hypothetical protein AB7G44_03690 [Bacteroidia bacterium]
MRRVLLFFAGSLWLSTVFAQLPKATVQPQRGFSFNFSNEKHKNFPQVVYVWPLSDAERAGLRSGMVIATVNDTYFAKKSQQQISDFLINLPATPLVMGMLTTSSGNDFSAPVNKNFPAFIPPVQSTHPDGECISGNCMDGEGYIKFTNRDYFRGIFKAGKPVEGEYHEAATASRKKIPEPVIVKDTMYLFDLTTADGTGGFKFKRLYPGDKSARPDIHFESGRMYRGELKGLVPHGKGEVHYTKNKIIDPIPNQSVMGTMILEGEFDNGTFVKATRLRTDAFSGMFIEGGISAGLRKGYPFWQAYNASLKVWSYSDAQNNRVDEIRTVFESKPGNYCIDGKFNGPGIWYCNQYGYSPLYGAEIHVLKMTEGFVQDSVELVIPHLNYRKFFSVVNNPRKFLRLDLLEDYIEIYYTTGKVPSGNWNTATGAYVVKPPPPPPKTYTIKSFLQEVAVIYKQTIQKEVPSMKIIAEGSVLSDDYLSTGLTFGEYVDYAEAVAYLVISLKDAAVEVSGPDGKCAPVVSSANEAPVKVQQYDCTYNNEQQYKKFAAFKTTFYKPGTEIYYLMYKISNK